MSSGTLYTGNQSIVVWVARMLTGTSDLGMTAELGPIDYLGFVVAGGAIFVLWRLRRHAPLVPLELGALILVILVAGPLSWDHYFVWAVIPVVLMADGRYWSAGEQGTENRDRATAAIRDPLFAEYVRVPSAAAVRGGLVAPPHDFALRGPARCCCSGAR